MRYLPGMELGQEKTRHSHAETAELPCRACGTLFASEVWVIIDTDERPDLLARVRAATLHDMICPHCGHAATVNAPLLLYRPGQIPNLLYSPARGGDPTQHEEQAEALLGILQTRLGAALTWPPEGVPGVAREALPTVLRDDPATVAALAEALAVAPAAGDMMGDAVPPALREALQEIVLALAAEGVRILTAEDLGRALQSRPELRARIAGLLRDDATAE